MTQLVQELQTSTLTFVITFTASIASLLSFIVPLLQKYIRNLLSSRRKVQTAESQNSNSEWMDCRYCNGSGSVLVESIPSSAKFETCGICGGHGQLVTKLVNQPDCRRCCGTGKLGSSNTQKVGRRKVTKNFIQPCDVCHGIGKRPELVNRDKSQIVKVKVQQ